MFPARTSKTSNPQAALRASAGMVKLNGTWWSCFGGVAQAGAAPSRPPPSTVPTVNTAAAMTDRLMTILLPAGARVAAVPVILMMIYLLVSMAGHGKFVVSDRPFIAHRVGSFSDACLLELGSLA